MIVILEELLATRFVPASPNDRLRQNLCLDAGYVGKQDVVFASHYQPHIRPRGEEKKELKSTPNFHARRWVVVSCHSWFKCFRKICPLYEKALLSYNGLLSLAACRITLNKAVVICG